MIPGIDVSKYQGLIDWPAVASSGIRFAFVRTGDGIDHADTRFDVNWEGARRAGVVRGPYHFLRCSLSPQRQADLLIDSVYRSGLYLVSDLPPACDLEEESLGAGVTPSRAVECALAFAASIERRLGRAPILYTTPNTMRQLGDARQALAGRFPTLWISHVKAPAPAIPAPFSRAAFWQHSWTGRVDGIATPVDLDWFFGDERDMQRLIAMSEVLASP